MKSVMFGNAVKLAHQCMRAVVGPSDTVVDATCGNGHDTLFLARLVPEGRVLAFDTSEEAVHNTSKLLAENGVRDRVEVYQRDHREIKEVVNEPVKGIMFNLGYLPGGPRDTATVAEVSREAIRSALPLLKTGGLLTIVAYPGYDEGAREYRVVQEMLVSLDQREYEVLEMRFLNQINFPPVLIAVYRR